MVLPRCEALPVGVGSTYFCRFIGRDAVVTWASSTAACDRNIIGYGIPNISTFGSIAQFVGK